MNSSYPPPHDHNGYNRGYRQGYDQGYNQGYNQASNSNYSQPPMPGEPSPAFMANDLFADSPEGKNRGLTALLCLFLGTLDIHYFYLGKVKGGLIYIAITLFTCGGVSSILAFIQAIMLFCMNNQEFRRKYILSNSVFPF